MKAIVLGATGATGRELLDNLLKDNRFSQVTIFVRRDLGINNPKLTQYIIDFDNENEWKHLVQGDVLFSCLGTTLKAAGSKEAQWKIDYDYQFSFAKIAKENGVEQYILISSMGADAKSSIFYYKMKGELEEAAKVLSFKRLVIVRPPILERKNSDRKGEIIGVKIIHFLNKLGLFTSQKPLKTEFLAKTMIKLSLQKEKGIFILSAKDIRDYITEKS